MTFANRYPRPALARRGLVLPLVLIALAIAIILGLAFLTSASTATSLSSAADHRLRARMIAESGLSMTLGYLESERNWRTLRANGAWVTNQALDGGTFTVTGEDGDQVDALGAVVGDGNLADDPNDPVLLTSIGTYGDARHLVRAVRYPPKTPGIAVSERVEVKTSGLVDSYDPERGPYSVAIATARAIAQSNGLSRQTYIRLRERSRVNGNVYYGVNSVLAQAVIKDATAVVTGTITPLPAAIATPVIVEPNWANNTGANQTYSSGTTLITTDTWFNNFAVRGTAVVRAVGDVKVYVGGSMTVTDDARIEIGNPCAYGAGIKGAINIDSTVPVDSYDSSLGAYGGTNVSSKAVIATNSVLPGAVTVSSAIKGDVYSGVGSTPATSILVVGGSVSGVRAALTTPMTIPAPPAWPTDVPASIGDCQVIDTTRNVAANLQTGHLSIEGNGILRITGDRVIRVNGDFELSGNGQIDIPATATLKMYVGGQIRLTGNGSAANNTTKAPQRFVLYGMGSGYTHRVDGNAIMFGIIDAPNSSIHLDGNAKLYGAIMASALTMTNNAELHNDRNAALVDANPRLAASGMTGNKLTLYTNKGVTISQRGKVNNTTANPLNVAMYHVGPAALNVSDTASVYAEVTVPKTTLNLAGASRWNGRIDARDLRMGGTAVVTADASGGTARPAVLVEETVEMTGDAVINGTGGTALLASRGHTDSTIHVTDTSTFKGDGYTAVGGDPAQEIRVGAAATFTGVKGTQLYPVSIAAPAAPPVTTPVIDSIFSGGTTSTISGDVYCANFEIMDNTTVQVAPDTRLILTGRFRMVDNARLVLQPSARLVVYCPGEVEIWENARVNLDGNPRHLTFYATATTRIELRDDARLCANLVAPLAELELNNTAEFYGSFAGRRLKIDRTAKFHAAHAAPGPVTWIEQE